MLDLTLPDGVAVAANVTIPAPVGEDRQFGRLSVIGMFLALQLCQLTQPYGSLLFRGYGGFFWRCNPLASLTEACIILWHLGKAIYQSRQETHSAILKTLHEVSSSLLLLRGALGKDDVGGLMETLLNGSFLDAADSPTISPASEPPAGYSSGVSAEETPRPVVSRQPTLESNRPAQEPQQAPDPLAERSRILREALGSNALAHKELRIDIITTFTEFTIFLKLIAIRGDGWFTAASMFLIVGWFTLQLLLIILHVREASEMEMAASVRLARKLDAQLKSQSDSWLTLFLVLHLPFFGYPAYLASFHAWFPPDAQGFAAFLSACGLIARQMITMVVLQLSFWGGLVFFFSVCVDIEDLVWRIAFIILFPPSFIWLSLSAGSYFQQNCGEAHNKYCQGNFTSYFTENTTLYYIVDRSFDKIYHTAWLLIFLVVITAIYGVLTVSDQTGNRTKRSNTYAIGPKRNSPANALFVLVVFVLYLIWYDPSKTYKPAWLDVLG